MAGQVLMMDPEYIYGRVPPQDDPEPDVTEAQLLGGSPKGSGAFALTLIALGIGAWVIFAEPPRSRKRRLRST